MLQKLIDRELGSGSGHPEWLSTGGRKVGAFMVPPPGDSEAGCCVAILFKNFERVCGV